MPTTGQSMSDKPRIQVSSNGEYRIDAWQNAASGMGMPGMDKSLYGRFALAGSKLEWRTLSTMFRYDWLTRKICERPAHDAVRRWINLDDDKIKSELERLGVKGKARKAISWGRLYGGAALLLIVEDGMTPADPLRPEKVKRVVDVKVVDRNYLQPQGKIADPYATYYGEPEFYTTTSGVMFHHTRVLKFQGADLTQDEMEQEQYWGGSFVELYNEAVRAFQASMQDVRFIMTESSVGQLKIPGLTQSVAMGGKIFDVIQKRLDQFNLSKSIYRTAAMDADEEFDFKNRQLTGLADLLDRFMTSVSGATEMPQLVLFGTTPGGLNASQDEQLSVYYDMIRSVQEGDLMMALNTVIACLNKGVIPEWDYNPLMEPTDLQRADIRLKEAQTLQAVADVVALEPDEARKHLNSTGHFDLADNADDDWMEGDLPLSDQAAINPESAAADLLAKPGGETIAQVSMNGAQIASLVDVLSGVAANTMPVEAAREIIAAAFPLEAATIEKMLAPMIGFNLPGGAPDGDA